MGPPAAYPGQQEVHPDLGQAALALANNFTAARQFFGHEVAIVLGHHFLSIGVDIMRLMTERPEALLDDHPPAKNHVQSDNAHCVCISTC